MTTYFLFGNYSDKAYGEISSQRTAAAEKVIADQGGKLQSMHALVGDPDLVLIIDFPDIKAALKTSVELGRLTGISFRTSQALTVQEFDQLMAG